MKASDYPPVMGHWLRFVALSVLILLMAFGSAQAQTADELYPRAHEFFPQADRFSEFSGEPPAAEVYRDDELLGYLLVTDDVVRIPAYSGKPVNLLVGMDTSGVITGAEVLEHHEPILLVGIPEQKLFDFADQYVGLSVSDRVRVGGGGKETDINVDAVSGATVTVVVVGQSIMRSARKLAISRGIIEPTQQVTAEPGRVLEDVYRDADWATLTGDGSIRRLYLDFESAEAAFAGTEAEGRGPKPEPGCAELPQDHPCHAFISLYYTHLNPPTIGKNLLGDSQYEWLMGKLEEGEHAIALMANGAYSFKGSGYVRGGIFDRIQVEQDRKTISFRDTDYHRLSDVDAEGIPDFREMGIFIIREESDFDPGRDWQLELLVMREVGPLDRIFSTFGAEYRLPDEYVERPEPVAAGMGDEEEAIWVSIWQDKPFQIGVLAVALLLLTTILFFQDWLVRRARLFWWVRNGFLVFTVFFIGWYTLAQLSIVNVLTFTDAVFHGFSWDTFLLDPLMFILWSYVALTLLLWGRGVYCGWLCPFGALQELLNKIARYVGIRQFDFPQLVHERLWAVKYIILVVLFGVSLQSIGAAERMAEVEPFKTTIMLKFQREWSYVFYAVILLAISVFNRKFYCKYLCPLGAALAVPARLRLFDWWLRRRKECGKPCQVCAKECEVQAIHPTGEINPNECHFCLDCQATYWNDHKCPPLVERRKRKEMRMAKREVAVELPKKHKADIGT
ncbi:transcriptional regulator NosR [Thiohalomonas denitrificans]|uniref:transcriptional regulator NosR n=1 Tax=Thiohalomonas denitrificans TaxID=415747 RepID=UPI0026EB53FC|nr:NosR/NirI family protein [Thiohalomonas denitrificans]